ncbi:hypothetical protein TNCV_1853901 [Trichonephila clavipes]|nr:hypothetical protein TNCV_1853901 [Trichonephila clavipes]
MFDSSSYDNPTPLAHADTSRDVFPRGVGKDVQNPGSLRCQPDTQRTGAAIESSRTTVLYTMPKGRFRASTDLIGINPSTRRVISGRPGFESTTQQRQARVRSHDHWAAVASNF